MDRLTDDVHFSNIWEKCRSSRKSFRVCERGYSTSFLIKVVLAQPVPTGRVLLWGLDGNFLQGGGGGGILNQIFNLCAKNSLCSPKIGVQPVL